MFYNGDFSFWVEFCPVLEGNRSCYQPAIDFWQGHIHGKISWAQAAGAVYPTVLVSAGQDGL